jgi:hypothetical protein
MNKHKNYTDFFILVIQESMSTTTTTTTALFVPSFRIVNTRLYDKVGKIIKVLAVCNNHRG